MRKLFGFLFLVFMLFPYCLIVMWGGQFVAWNKALELIYYVFFGFAWAIPLKSYFRWISKPADRA